MKGYKFNVIIQLKRVGYMVNINKERMKIYVLDNGTMKMDKNLMIANSN